MTTYPMNQRGNLIELPLMLFVVSFIGIHMILVSGAQGHWASWPVVCVLGLLALPLAIWLLKPLDEPGVRPVAAGRCVGKRGHPAVTVGYEARY